MDGSPFNKIGEIRISLLWLNIVAVFLAIPSAVLFGVADVFLHGVPDPSGWDILWFVAVFTAQTVVHELLHAVGYMVLGKLHWKQLKFGVNWKAMAPYCNCLFPIAMGPFRWSAILPVLVLTPISMALWLGSGDWWMAFMTAAVLLGGIGDIYIIFKTLKHPSDCYILEHPSGIGGDLFVPAK